MPEVWSSQSPAEWAAWQYQTLKLADARLETRLLNISETLAAKPLDSLNQACPNWAQAKGAYRFIENEKVTVEDLTTPPSEATAKSCAGRRQIIAIQDTTTLSFKSAPHAVGLGPVNDSSQGRGLFFHPVLAVREDGLLLGLLHQYLWWRDPQAHKTGKKTKAHRPMEQKESQKWANGITGARQVLNRQLSPDQRPRLIHVFDREGDIHQVFEMLVPSADGAVIRSSFNRRVITPQGQIVLAHDLIRETPPLGEVTIQTPRAHGQKQREATLQVRAVLCMISPDKDKYPRRRSLPLTLVEVWEPNPPVDAQPLHWLLWTTESVFNLEQALAVVNIYTLRWTIEEYFLVLKNGCRLEQLQLETAKRLAKLTTIYAPIAARILQLRHLAERWPDQPCTVILTKSQWQALFLYFSKVKPQPDTPVPTLHQALMWIGRLGGHLGRKSDGRPGVRTLWRGWRDLTLLATVYELTQNQ